MPLGPTLARMQPVLLSGTSTRAWQDFFEEGRTDRAPPPVRERWARVRRLGLPQGGAGPERVVTARELRERHEANRVLLQAAAPCFEQSAPLFAEHDYVLLLTDAEGLVLLRTAGGRFNEVADEARLIEGADWAEGLRGVNAIGTALVEKRPIGVIGEAHSAKPNHPLACFASPVRAPDGRVIGTVDATSGASAASRIITLAVCGVAQDIEERLRANDQDALLRDLKPLIDRLLEPALLLGQGGVVAYRNASARKWDAGGDLERQLGSLPSGPGICRLETEGGTWAVRVEPLSTGHRLVLPGRTPKPRSISTPSAPSQLAFSPIVGDDPVLLDAKRRAARFAASDLPVLLLAETGTGKELMARAIHDASPRRDHPYIALNCAALSPQLLESELFGYGDGAFTGANPGGKTGKLAAADGGTLFLDEIAEMPAALQALLLRVLEDGTYYRVGEVEPRHVKLRLICATCRDLPAMVASGNFRSDLYFRIRGACLGLPPLRERSDLRILVDHFIGHLAAAQDRPVPRISPETQAVLRAQTWPGNVRELRSALAHALALADDEIRPEHLPGEPPVPCHSCVNSREDAEKQALFAALDACGGNLSDAARRLRVARSTLYRMMDRHDLPRPGR